MTAAFNIEDALTDPQLLGAGLGPIASWSAWLAVLKGAYGLPLSDGELATFQSVTGNRKPPSKRVDELWNVVGRRGGKSEDRSGAGGVRGVLHRSRCQAVPRRDRSRLGAGQYRAASQGRVQLHPRLHRSVTAVHAVGRSDVLAHEIRLKNHISISVHPSSFRSVRGRTLLCAILDEVSFWRDDASANPDDGNLSRHLAVAGDDQRHAGCISHALPQDRIAAHQMARPLRCR